MKTLPALLLSGAALALAVTSARGVEYLSNGNFEGFFYGNGVPNYWKANNGDGVATLAINPHVSPFTNIFPTSQYAMELTDGIGLAQYPNLTGPVTSVPSTSYATSFEFSLGGAQDGMWRLNLGSSALSFLFLPGNKLSLPTRKEDMPLNAATWYQVNATVNATSRRVSGTLQPYGGAAVPFSGTVGTESGSLTPSLFTVTSLVANAAAAPLYLDNISIRTVPEPSVAALLLMGAAGVLLRRPRGAREIRP